MIAGLGIALPPSATQDELWDGFFAEHYAGGRRGLAKRIFENSGVRTRQAAVSPLLEDVSGWSTERRMRRYQVEAMPLGKEAVGRALTDAGVAADELGPVRGLLVHRLRDTGAGHPARPRHGHVTGRAAALRRPHGLLRGAAGPGHGGRLRGRPAAGRRCCSAPS